MGNQGTASRFCLGFRVRVRAWASEQCFHMLWHHECPNYWFRLLGWKQGWQKTKQASSFTTVHCTTVAAATATDPASASHCRDQHQNSDSNHFLVPLPLPLPPVMTTCHLIGSALIRRPIEPLFRMAGASFNAKARNSTGVLYPPSIRRTALFSLVEVCMVAASSILT